MFFALSEGLEEVCAMRYCTDGELELYEHGVSLIEQCNTYGYNGSDDE